MEFKTKIDYIQTRFDVTKLPDCFVGADIKVYKNSEHGRFLVVLNYSEEVKKKIWGRGKVIIKIVEEVIQGLKDNNLINDPNNWEDEKKKDSEKFEKRCNKLDLNPNWHFFVKIKKEVIAKL